MLKGGTYTFEDGISVYAHDADDANKKHENIKAKHRRQEKENECLGCKCDLTNRVVKDGEELFFIMERCGKCKRAKLQEYKSEFDDLYIEQ